MTPEEREMARQRHIHNSQPVIAYDANGLPLRRGDAVHYRDINDHLTRRFVTWGYSLDSTYVCLGRFVTAGYVAGAYFLAERRRVLKVMNG